MFKRALTVLEPHLHPAAAIRSGVTLAKACHAEIVFYTGLGSARPPAADLPDREMAAQWDALEDARGQTERLHLQARQLAEGLGLMSRSVIATAKKPVRGILNAAITGRCEVIVVASEGSNAVVRLLTGSFIPGLVTASPVPVVVCPPVPSAGMAAHAALRRFMVVLEEGDVAGVARQQGLDLARDHGAELLFVHITPSDVAPVVDATGFVAVSNDRLAAAMRLQSHQLLARACAAAARAGLTARSLSLPAGTTASEIAHIAAEQACALTVVAHRGNNAVMRLLTGSLIPGLITAAAASVLICRDARLAPKRRSPRRRHHRDRAAAAAAEAAVARATHRQGH